MPPADHKALLQIFIFTVLILNTLFTYSYASIKDEKTIDSIVETRGKNHVVNFILHKRHGRITIQKKKSFVNVTGRPDITLVTSKTIIHDLKNLDLSIDDMKTELDAYIAKALKKQQREESNLRKSASMNNDEIPQSRKLKYQINKTKKKYIEATSDYDRKRLKRELSRLQRKYKEAKFDEKHNPEGTTSTKSRNKTRRNSSASYCESNKTKLQKMTGSSYRHQIFFCNDRDYRSKNPKSCGKYSYSKKYSLPEYKKELSRLRQNVSKYCGS